MGHACTLSLCAALFAVGCARASPASRPPPPRQASTTPAAAPTAEEAKRAVVELIRTHPHTFIGNPDPDRLASLPLLDRGDGTYTFGVIVVNPAKGRYSATVGEDAPEVYLYHGTISRENGAWVASEPEVARLHRHP